MGVPKGSPKPIGSGRKKGHVAFHKRPEFINYLAEFKKAHPDFNVLEEIYQLSIKTKDDRIKAKSLDLLAQRMVPILRSIEVTGGPSPFNLLRDQGDVFRSATWQRIAVFLGIKETDLL